MGINGMLGVTGVWHKRTHSYRYTRFRVWGWGFQVGGPGFRAFPHVLVKGYRSNKQNATLIKAKVLKHKHVTHKPAKP